MNAAQLQATHHPKKTNHANVGAPTKTNSSSEYRIPRPPCPLPLSPPKPHGGTKASCPATGTTTVQMIGAALSIARGSSPRLSTLRS